MTQSGNEKELVLGNKQLLGIFFVGTALCAVFFAMGYMVGRNSVKNLLATTDASTTAPASTDTSHRQQPEPPRETTADPSAQSTAADSPAPVETKPAQDTSAPAPVTTAEPTKEASTEPKPAHVTVATPEADATYLQVTALPRPDADNMIRTLREQNFPAILAASSKDGLFRVLVGPYHQTAQLADAKARLKTLGFANAFVQRQ